MAIFSYPWDSDFEGAMSTGSSLSEIDDELRLTWAGIRERVEAEHSFGPYTEEDDGSHIPGKTTVMLKGNAGTRDALTDMQNGALYALEDGSDVKLFCYIAGTGWVEISNLDHADLTDLGTNIHTQYLLRAGGEMTGDLNMGAQQLLMPSIEEIQQGFVQWRHANLQHATLANEDAIKDGVVLAGKCNIVDKSASGVTTGTRYRQSTISGGLMFMPNVYVVPAGIAYIVAPTDGLLGVGLVIGGSAVTWRINFRYMVS